MQWAQEENAACRVVRVFFKTDLVVAVCGVDNRAGKGRTIKGNTSCSLRISLLHLKRHELRENDVVSRRVRDPRRVICLEWTLP